MRALLAICAAGAVAACAPARPAQDAAAARIFSDVATATAVARTGARVCRSFPVGISEMDLVRGVVAQAEGGKIAIRIGEAGRIAHSIGGVTVAPNAVVWDEALAWKPCV